MLTNTQITNIINESLTLPEIIYANNLLAKPTPKSIILDESFINNYPNNPLLQKWIATLNIDKKEHLISKRMKWSNWNNIDIALLLEKSLHKSKGIPKWIKTLKYASKTAKKIALLEWDQLGIPEHKHIEFSELLQVFMLTALNDSKILNLMKDLGFSRKARIAIESTLYFQILRFSKELLKHELDCLRFFKQNKYTNEDDLTSRIYEDFIRDNLRDGLSSLFVTYPMFARLSISITLTWRKMCLNFLQRLKRDADAIEKAFSPKSPIGNLVDLDVNKGDNHNGESVMILEFENGTKCVYKPKNISMERSYQDFLNFLKQKNKLFRLPTIKILNRANYGWVEFVKNRPLVKSVKEVKDYYKISGQLIFLAYALNGVDFHNENIIVCDGMPFLIDLETLMYPRYKNTKVDSSFVYFGTILQSSLLPTVYDHTKDESLKKFHLRSGLGAVDTSSFTNNRDRIEVKLKNNYIQHKGNIVNIWEYQNEVIFGFREAYVAFLQSKDSIIKHKTFLHLSHSMVRYIPRVTIVYDTILELMASPINMSNGVHFSIESEILYKDSLIGNNKPTDWDLIEFEQQSLLKGEIPFFGIPANNKFININGKKISCVQNSGEVETLNRINAMSLNDLEYQIGLIDESITMLRNLVQNEQQN